MKATKILIVASILVTVVLIIARCGDSIESIGSDTGNQDVTLKSCKNSAQCNVDEECKNNVCVKKETTVCRNKTDCRAEQDCINGKCVDIQSDAGMDGGDINDADVNTKKGKISTEPAILDFGAMRFGERRELTVKVKNIGDAVLKVTGIEFDKGVDSNTFSFKTDFKPGSFLDPDDYFDITVSCTQTDSEPDSGDLLISSDDTDTPILRIKVKNAYKDPPDLLVTFIDSENKEVSYPDNSPNNELIVDVGNTPLNEKKVQIINLQNIAEEGILKIIEVKMDIYNANETNVNKFSARLKDKADGSEINTPVYLSGSDSAVLEIEYSADKEAIDDRYDISVKVNDKDVNNDGSLDEEGLLIIHIKARGGYKEPELAILDLNGRDILSEGIDFGEVEKNITEKSVFKICNAGGGILNIDKSSGLDNSVFTLNPSSLEASLKFDQCINNVEVGFTPSTVGESRGNLIIISNDKGVANSETRLAIKGTGINAEMRINPLTIDFGDVLLNSAATPVQVEIKNIGDGTLKIYSITRGSGSSSDFSLTGLPQVLPEKIAPNSSIFFNVEFKPSTLGEKSGSVVVTSSDSDNLTVEITLFGNGSNCDSDHADCNKDPSDGCEVDLNTDINNCGQCAYVCDPTNADAVCVNKKCVIESCKGTYLDCNNDVTDGCEANKLTDNLNCGECFKECGDKSYCSNGNCLCAIGYLNCDNDFSTGCEVDQNNDVKNCGGCFNNCGDNSVCTNGVCGCLPNYKNCNNQLSDGCEVNIKTNPNNCGDCNVKCGSSAYCNDGICTCNDGYGNCNGDWFDGCEKYLMFDKYNCGQCGKACQNLPNTSASCNFGSCEYTCNSGYKNCDNNWDNGCESFSNTDSNNCGGCGIKCGNNMECNNGICQCKSGFANCNGDLQDGCEVNLLNNSSNCGVCNNSCGSNAFCNNGSCDCNIGYANCNNLWSDGCEVDLLTNVYNCGSCGHNCTSLPNVASASCINSNCVINSCNEHTANCDSNVNNGCEINHNSYANACGTYIDMGELCGDDGTPTLGPVMGYGSKWFRFRVKECDDGIIADKLAALISLDVPNAPVDYDLVLYVSCGVLLGSYPKGPGVDEAIEVVKDDEQCWPGNCDDSFYIYVEVKYIGGGTDQCNQWSLTVTSNDGWY